MYGHELLRGAAQETGEFVDEKRLVAVTELSGYLCPTHLFIVIMETDISRVIDTLWHLAMQDERYLHH